MHCVVRQRAVRRISGRALDPTQVDIIFHLFGAEDGADSLDPDRFAQVTQSCPCKPTETNAIHLTIHVLPMRMTPL